MRQSVARRGAHNFRHVDTIDGTDEYRCPCGVRQRWRRVADGVVHEVYAHGLPGDWYEGPVPTCPGYAPEQRAKRLTMPEPERPPMPDELHRELVPQLWSRGRSDAQ